MSVVLVAMTQAELDDFLQFVIPDFAADKVAAGQWSEATALEKSRLSYLDLLPDGVASRGHHLFTVRDSAGTDVGVVWLALPDGGDEGVSRTGFIYELFVRPEYRRKGHASAALAAIEAFARDLGATGIELHVFGHNLAARALYTKIGYVETSVNMSKQLD